MIEYDTITKKGHIKMTKESSKFKRITVTLTPKQLDLLTLISEQNGYESLSATLRVMVTKYGNKEIKQET